MSKFTIIVAMLLCLATVPSVAAPPKESKAGKLAKEAVTALRNINSALKVGVNNEKYTDKVIVAQEKVDAYRSDVDPKKFGGFGDKLSATIKHYIFAGSLWQLMIDNGHGIAVVERGTDTYDQCVTGYPDTAKPQDKGGASYQDGKFLWGEDCRRIVWETAEKAAAALKPPK